MVGNSKTDPLPSQHQVFLTGPWVTDRLQGVCGKTYSRARDVASAAKAAFKTLQLSQR
jgi:hypothetical protein